MISNSSLKELSTCDPLLAPTYMACTTLTNHSSTPITGRARHSAYRGTLSKTFSNCLKIKIASVVPQPGPKPNCISSMLTVSRMMISTTLSITF